MDEKQGNHSEIVPAKAASCGVTVAGSNLELQLEGTSTASKQRPGKSMRIFYALRLLPYIVRSIEGVMLATWQVIVFWE